MFRLKLIKKPILLKLKCNFSFPPIVLANMQEKEVIPTKEKQEIVPDKNYDGLSKVIVDKIPDEYIIPTGNIEITKNGIYNVREKETANVNIPVLKLGTKNITENGVYKASDDELDGYSEVNVETSGVDINDYFKPTIAAATNTQYTNGINAIIKKIPDTITLTGDSCASMFQYCAAITTIPPLDTSGVNYMHKMFFHCDALQTIPPLNTSKVTNMVSMFEGCTSLQTIPAIDTSKVTNFTDTFYSCSALTSLPLLNMSSATNLANILYKASNIINIGGFTDLGNGYLTSTSANYYSYTLNVSTCTKLTETSIINILNNLYDIKTKGCNAQQVVLGRYNLSKLTSEEGQQALSSSTEKGWSIS